MRRTESVTQTHGYNCGRDKKVLESYIYILKRAKKMIADDHSNEQNIWLVIFQAWTIQDIALERSWQQGDSLKMQTGRQYRHQCFCSFHHSVELISEYKVDLSNLSHTMISDTVTFRCLLCLGLPPEGLHLFNYTLFVWARFISNTQSIKCSLDCNWRINHIILQFWI